MELFTISLSAFMVNVLTDLLKMLKLTAWQTRGVVLGLSLLMGVVWYVFQAYVPVSFQIEVQNFVAGTLAGAVFIYEFLTKHIE